MCSTLLIVKEMQTKTTVKYHHTPIRMATIKKSKFKCYQEFGGKGSLVHYWWRCKLVQPLWKTVWSFFKILKIELPYDLIISLWGINPKEMKQDLEKISALPCSLQYQSYKQSMYVRSFHTWKQSICWKMDKDMA